VKRYVLRQAIDLPGAVEITLTSGLTGGGEGIAEEEFSTARNASEARPYSHLVLGCFLLLFSAFCMTFHSSNLCIWTLDGPASKAVH
jgi:hypothetical protein